MLNLGKMNPLHRLAARKPKTVSKAAPFFNVIEQTEDSPAEIYLYGDVYEEAPRDWWTGEVIDGMYITLENVINELERVRDATEMTIHLNSSGGDLFAGVTIHNLIKSFAGKKNVIVDGLAASAASIIMCAGDNVQVYPGSMVMIHNVSSLLYGYYSTPEIKQLLTSHEATESSMVRIYEAKCKKQRDEIQSIIDATTWYIGQDAVDEGFADELIEEDEEIETSMTDNGEYLMVAGVPHLISNLGNLPSWINQTQVPVAAKAANGYKPNGGADTAPEEEKEDGMTITNTAELRGAYPEMVAEIEAEAVSAERERIHSIQDIAANIGNSELVNRAMFDEPISAPELALMALKMDANTRQTFINELEEDAEEAQASEVAPLPASEEADEDAALMADVMETVNLYKGMKGSR